MSGTRDMNYLELIVQGFLFQVPETCIWDVVKRAIPEYLQEGFMINGHCKILTSQSNVF